MKFASQAIASQSPISFYVKPEPGEEGWQVSEQLRRATPFQRELDARGANLLMGVSAQERPEEAVVVSPREDKKEVRQTRRAMIEWRSDDCNQTSTTMDIPLGASP